MAKGWKKIAYAVAGLVIALGTAELVGLDEPESIFYFIAGLFLMVALHEVGHVIAAKMNGFRLLLFAVWPFLLLRRGGKWRLTIRGKLAAAGYVAADPLTAEDLRRRMIRFVAGGPAASAMVGMICLAATKIYHPRPEWIREILILTAFWAISTFVLGLIPYRGGWMMNDAARLQMLWRDDVHTDRFCALMLLSGAARASIRPRDLNPELIAKMPGPEDKSSDWIAGSLMKYNWLVDSGREQEARAVLLGVLDQELPRPIQQQLRLQAAIIEARAMHDLEAAKKWFAMNEGVKRRDDVYQNVLLRAQAAIALLEGRLDDAEGAARKSLERGAKIEDSAAMIVIREKTEELLAEIAAARLAIASGSPGNAERADPARSLR